ncbi:bifunctional pyr operon transcriptional regulator/uracil phosphoribosyltransferase PyrR [Maledivibacter halophilus]|uniref:Bifunctional protein PyrR n=1 Tax=Maledivibacter halophilus TaxID=36842 RepID=A0A1T5MHB8_9FIRM|nr:bifunctional pyr operon transcriptional regulator/uracil phosphoribosyltransferase PyrR [Maledivibacter halophilus]SKC87279.1 pyrimidine operon attenuation protein / uracil phosphoribosyltransferase [Maledivibacter halophilus]
MKLKAKIMDAKAINRSVTRLSHEIIEKNKGVSNIVLFGIHTRGIPLAKRIASKIKEIEDVDVIVDSLDITLYRDDLSKINDNPIINKRVASININDKDVVLIDDVIFTGRTVRAAMDALIDMGRPKTIQLAVLVDRGHRELPIRPDFIGKNVPTSRKEIISVKFDETDNENEVVIYEK